MALVQVPAWNLVQVPVPAMVQEELDLEVVTEHAYQDAVRVSWMMDR
jgi:hypothetical protein